MPPRLSSLNEHRLTRARRAGIGAEANDVAGIGRKLGLIEDDMKHGRILLRRAGLDYHEYARVQVHERFDDFIIAVQPQRLFTCSTRGRTRYSDVHYQAGDTLVLGPETRGLPQELLDTVPAAQHQRIPMVASSRSLNLSNAAAVIVYEAWRQLSFIGGQ